MSNVKLDTVKPKVDGRGVVTAPATRDEQISKLQAELKTVRAQQAILAERRTALETSLHALHAEAAVIVKVNKLSDAEKDALVRCLSKRD